MTGKYLLPVLATLALLLWLPAVGAHGASRAWVSGHGTDAAGCGAPTAPCRSLQYAHDNAVVAGGEIDILDPAGYGAILITKAISIVNDGVGTAGVQAASGGTAIIVQAPTGAAVRLRGLNIEGLGMGAIGIYFAGGSRLSIEQTSISDFTGDGVLFVANEPNDLIVIDTRVSNVGADGVDCAPSGGIPFSSAQVVIDHLVVAYAQVGLAVDMGAAAQGSKVDATVSNSILSRASNFGVYSAAANSNEADVTLRDCVITKNATGVQASGSPGSFARVYLTRSGVTGNTTAFANSGGFIGSFGDNTLVGNANSGVVLGSVSPQ